MRGTIDWLWVLVVGVAAAVAQAAETGKAVLVDVQRIWDRAPHNAFTDLVRWKERWWCTFREGTGHVNYHGKLRVIVSDDGRQWESAVLMRAVFADLRDPKLCVTPAGELMLSGAAAMHPPIALRHQTVAWFSKDGRSWSEASKIGDPDFWLWRVTWHRGRAYGFGYGTRTDNRWIRLYTSTNGRKFDMVADKVFTEGYPNETSLVFLEDDTCYCLLRRDGQPNTAQLGIAQPPYKEWTWKDLGVRIGGPHMIRLPDGRFVAVVRLYDPVRTSVCCLDPEQGML
ncbi:MAG TPA: exo-alpha-sialidase, partial [Planctomycetaceae bacterium]|nr:exo-alpha-sialidase [Planctomycetaceae bacterium]